MAGGAGNPRLRSGVIYVVKLGIIKSTAEKWHHIMASGTPAGGFHVSIAFERNFAGFANAEEIGLVIERTEMVRAVEPTGVGVLVTFQAVIIHHQSASRNEITRGGARQGRFEVFRAFLRADHVPFARVLRVQNDHCNDDNPDGPSPTQADFPFDARAGETMQNIEPD